MVGLGSLNLLGASERIAWQLPTENDGLFQNQNGRFFQPTISRRLISGMFGFVRTSEPEPARIFEHFHKGIDIRALHRDARGEPTDVVRASAEGEVVRVNPDEKISDYGKQVIVRHLWGEQPVYTIYGHLASISVDVGQKVAAGDPLGIMGWTGPGLSRDRAHLHFEIAFQINPKFDEWVKAEKPGRLWEPNRHGEWNGLNLMGIDPVPLLKAANEENSLTWKEALSKQPGGFMVRVPTFEGTPTWMRWIERKSPSAQPLSWDIEMTPWGLPLRMEAGGEVVAEPVLVANPGKPSEGKYYCRGLVQADGKGGMKLSKFGRQTMEMMLYTVSTPSP
ncbi:MAG: M23 family metallopeptidase [Verrucomicrobia bacterium]|nr:M23 family metallopeptidase [Verrucomicrobiota bacterium]NBV96247.1 M23 family metallopeptidase [Verrucomicrobiota bacterium]NBY66810.1 M23 family metallopeptidase [Verrucomicrobiota bacterium]